MSKFVPGGWVWITDEAERYLPAKVLSAFSKGQPSTVMTEDGENHKLDAAMSEQVIECNTEALDSKIEDLINISDLNEMSILHNLRIRFKEDKIYTSISSILISVNPFKLLPLYTPEVLDKYRNGTRGLPPHVFAIAYNAYNNMLTESADQSVVISGESGAGKSEATKLILQFVTDVSSRAHATAGGVTNNLEQQILAANPILEAFGNAKTLRNNNSSRFGKLITINFDSNGAIIGGGIVNYLLEKSRVVTQTVGERNYHIFYQLLSCSYTNAKMADELKLQDAKMFDYLRKSEVTTIDGVSDEKEFEDVVNSMNVLQFTAEEQNTIWSIVAGVLYFGNLQFKIVKNSTSEDSSAIDNPAVAGVASALWGVKPDEIQKFLTAKNIGARESVLVSYNVTQAQDARDAMVKRVYADLFQFIVNKINSVLGSGKIKRHKFIGVLDIFGFESFEVNSFEQLCINFCNEKLQFHFNEHIFKMEQTLYAAEGIVIPGSSFVDNQPTLDLLELKVTGVFSMCDEEINVPKGSDEGFLQKVFQKHEKTHPNMIRPKPKDCKDSAKNFGILHYAGPVFYNVSNFLEKNKDQLHADIINVLRQSALPMLKGMFPDDPYAKGPSKKLTLGGQFKTQLNDLIATLNSTHPHFVRCMKSNDKKVGNIFHSGRMQDQLRYAGLVEVCRIRKLGFPVRRPFDEFYRRYKCIDVTSKSLDELLAVLSKKGVLVSGEWAKGKSRVFMRTKQSADLELAREEAFKVVVKVVQKMARGYIYRQRFKNCLRIMKTLHECIRARDEAPLTKAIDMAFELPYGGTHLKVYKDARVLQSRLREEFKVTKLLESAVTMKEINSLQTAIEATRAMNPPFATPLLPQAEAMLKTLLAEQECKKGLTTAVNAKNLQGLVEYIAKATALGIKCVELDQAVSLKGRIEQENDLIAKVTAAASANNSDQLNELLSKCVEMGLDQRPEIVQAQRVKEQLAKDRGDSAKQIALDKQAQAKRAEAIAATQSELTDAMASGDTVAVSAALQKAVNLGMNTPEVKAAQDMIASGQDAGDAADRCAAIIKVLQMKADTGILDSDVRPLASALEMASRVKPAPASLTEYMAALQLYTQHAKAFQDLTSGMERKDRLKLKGAVELAEDLDLQLEVMRDAKDLLRELELEYREKKASGQIEEEPIEYDEAEEVRFKRQELAKQARFDIKNFANLRSSDDYAKGVIMNKAKVKEQFLTFQNAVIPKSCTNLSAAHNRLALQIHRDLLGYMGDKKMNFSPMLAQDILKKGSECKEIRDEIFVQIIKQLQQNPRPESVAKGWQVMCMCVGTFPPGPDFENFLLHYIIEKRDKGKGAVVDYARYCLRTLEAMLISGEGTGFVPSTEEIQAYTERPPILATIYLVDGNVITENLPLTPDLNVAKVLEMCAGWLDLKDPRLDNLGLFVYDCGETDDAALDEATRKAPYADLIRSPRPLRNDDYMGDVIVQKARQRRKYKFVLKKKIFIPSQNCRGNDPFYERLIYLQAEDETIIQGNIDIDDEDKVSYLAAISMAVAFGEEMGTTVDEIFEQNILDFIAPAWRTLKTDAEWAEQVLTHRDALTSSFAEDLQEQFLEVVQQSPVYGMHWFHTHRVPPSSRVPRMIESLPDDVLVGFNHEGMHICNTQRVLLISFPFADIYRWGGSSSQFSLILGYPGFQGPNGGPGDFEVTLITCQAADMAAIILDHIRAIIQEAG